MELDAVVAAGAADVVEVLTDELSLVATSATAVGEAVAALDWVKAVVHWARDAVAVATTEEYTDSTEEVAWPYALSAPAAAESVALAAAVSL